MCIHRSSCARCRTPGFILNDNLAGLGPTLRLGSATRFAGQRSMVNARTFVNKDAAARRETKMAAVESPSIWDQPSRANRGCKNFIGERRQWRRIPWEEYAMIDGVAYIIALHGVIAENRIAAQVFNTTPGGTKPRERAQSSLSPLRKNLSKGGCRVFHRFAWGRCQKRTSVPSFSTSPPACHVLLVRRLDASGFDQCFSISASFPFRL
jgi:hypothetical protein